MEAVNLIGPVAAWLIIEYGPVACVLVGLVAAGIGFSRVVKHTRELLK